jgi:hypothetical protein
MKKTKIFLTALTVLAVEGGALAFKLIPAGLIATCDTNPTVLKCVLEPTYTTFMTYHTGEIVDYDVYGKDCVIDPESGNYTCTTRTVAE